MADSFKLSKNKNVKNRKRGAKINKRIKNLIRFPKSNGNFPKKYIKYLTKKRKANQMKKKQSLIETIVIDTSDEDENDVIEIPMTPPPLLTIDSSESETETEFNEFRKPDTTTKNLRVKKENSSRCNSPSSVVSDDFIRQSDKVGLLTDTIDTQDELQININGNSTYLDENATKPGKTSECIFETEKKSNSQSDNYQVTEENFRAVDVYESESSDIPESIYQKGKKNETIISSDSENDLDISYQSRNILKRTNYHNDIEESDEDFNDGYTLNPQINFLTRGEAVEHAVTIPRKRQRIDNNSDDEFLKTISTIAQGKGQRESSPDSVSSTNSCENVTSRQIVENVLQNKNNEIEETALPDNSIDLDDIFNNIDALNTTADSSFEIQENLSESEDEIIETVDLSKTERKYDSKSSMFVVHTNEKYIGWNEEMIRFYDYSWGDENFNVPKIKFSMNSADNWRVHYKDLFPRKKQYSRKKCFNCCEYGHTRMRCPQPQKPPICYMCGELGHLEPRCPNTICLRCGARTNKFTRSCRSCVFQNRQKCQICKVNGHSFEACPDKWRRYHSTIVANSYPSENVDYNKKKSCCICASNKHLPEHCNDQTRCLDYSPAVSKIISHSSSYEDDPIRFPLARDVLAYNLLCEPDKNICFPFTFELTSKQYYGRFLEATGLSDMIAANKRNILQKRKVSLQQSVQKLNKNYVINPFARINAMKILDERIELNDNINEEESNFQLDIEEEKDDTNMNNDNSNSSIIDFNFAVQYSKLYEDKNDNTQSEKNEMDDINNRNANGEQPVIIMNNSNNETSFNVLLSESKLSTENNNAIEIISDKTKSNNKVEIIVEKINCKSQFSNNTIVEEYNTLDSRNKILDISLSQDSSTVLENNKNLNNNNYIDNQNSTNVESIASKNKNDIENKLKKKIKFSKHDKLPDYIPLCDDNNDDEMDKEYNDDITNKCGGISFKLLSKDDKTEEICEAKIYISKFHSNYLLSPQGTNFLTEQNKLFNIKTSLTWSSVGHVLFIQGVPSSQDKFQQVLMAKFRELSLKSRCQGITKRKDNLIILLTSNILQLKTNLGNVEMHYKTFLLNQRKRSKNGIRTSDRAKRMLNMILIGQAGLKDGRKHLNALLMKLKSLQVNNDSNFITKSERDDIEYHWKLIFSPFEHKDYENLIKKYLELVKLNKIPKLNINCDDFGKIIFNEENENNIEVS